MDINFSAQSGLKANFNDHGLCVILGVNTKGEHGVGGSESVPSKYLRQWGKEKGVI